MKNARIILILALGFLTNLSSCQKETESKKYDITGHAQKGPYIVGTNVTISELDDNLTPTGKNYYSTIIDEYGTFEFPDVEFTSNYVKLIADGQYYHEVKGYTPSERLTLTAIADIENSNSININILTHLEADRLEYLMKNSDMTFDEAKSQVQNEIFNIFSMNSEENINFEQLDITQSGDNNAKLLAISCIIQGNKMINELTECLTNIKTDIKTDGTLDNEETQKELMTSARYLAFNNIIKNLEDKFYLQNLPDFQTSINYFLENSNFESDLILEVPEISNNRINILTLSNDNTIYQDTSYCLASNYHIDGYHGYLVRLEKDTTVSWNYELHSNGVIDGWFHDCTYYNLECTLNEQDRLCTFPLEFSGTGNVKLTVEISSDNYGWSSTSKVFTLE